mgnify:CR=1 FL=1
MSDKTNFHVTAKKSLPLLIQYVPVVDRVHGAHHPEFHDVRRVFEALVKKVKTTDFDLADEFKQLRQTTQNYTVPGDVCETYEAVYVMLKELDEAYQA